MLTVIRKNQYFLTPIIVALTIISFIWFYSRTNLPKIGANDVARIYGRVLQRAQVEQLAREYQLSMALGMTDFVRDLGGLSENEGQAFTDFIFNDFVIQHEAARLGIVPSNEAIAAVIRSLPLFQSEGVFDSSKYQIVLKERFAPRGFTEQQLEAVVRNSLSLQKIHQVVVSPVAISEVQVRHAASIYQQVALEVLRFDRDAYLKEAKNKTISLEEKKAYYEKNKTAFMSEEKRSISFVVFEFSPEKKKLQGKERIQAMQQLSDAATALKQQSEEKMNESKSLEKIAAEKGHPVTITAEFNRRGEKGEALDSKKASSVIPPALLSTAFKMAKEGDLSEVIQVGQNFYLLSLKHITPAHPLTFAEVEPKIEALLRQQKAEQQMREVAAKTLQSIRQAMTTGKSFSEALKTTAITPIVVTGVSPSQAAIKNTNPQQTAFVNASLALKEGELSDLKHAPWGEYALYLQHRSPLNEADWKEHHEEIEKDLLEQQRALLFSEWLHAARNEAHIQMFDQDKRQNAKKTHR